MRRLQQRLLAFIMPVVSQSIVHRFGSSAGFIADKSVNVMLSMSAIDGDLHKNEIQDSQQLMACLRDYHMMSIDDYDRYVTIFQSRVKHISAPDILNWADGLPVELWRYYHKHHKQLVYGQTEHQILQQHIVFTLCGLSMVSYAGLYALVSDHKVHTAELQLLNQIMGHFEKPEKLFQYIKQEPSLSASQKNILGAEIRRYVEAFVQADLLPLTLIQHVMQTQELMSAKDQTRWSDFINDITEVDTKVIDDVNYFVAAKSFVAYEQVRLPLEGTVEQTRLGLVAQNYLTIESIALMAQLIEDEDERVDAASQLHDMALDSMGSIAQSDELTDDIDVADDDALPANPRWRAILQQLLESPKVTFELIEAHLANHVQMNERIDALQYIIIQLRKHKVQVYDQDVGDDRPALENMTIQNVRMLVDDVQRRMKQSIFATYESEYDRAYVYHELLSAGEERDLCVARDMLKSELTNVSNPDEITRIRQLDDEVRTLLINHNYRLVMHIAIMNTVHAYHLELMDLFQEGCIGLIKAVDRFDTSQNTRLSTYATWWIRQSIGRAIDVLDRSIRIPVHFLELIRRYRKMIYLYEKDHDGVTPSDIEIASILGIPLRHVDKIKYWDNRIASLHMIVGEEDAAELIDFVDDGLGFTDSVERQLLAEQIREALQFFDERDRTIIVERFGLDGGDSHTLEDIGTKLGITRERVRQIEKKVLLTLRRRNQSLAEYM